MSKTSAHWDANFFSFAPAGVGTTTAPSTPQVLTYAYDLDGNITNIVDSSNTGTAKTVNYAYDLLSRLTSASSSHATSSPDYLDTYAYDDLGNISSSPLGTYSYQGNTGSNYADPDAATQIGSATHAYDTDGNLTSDATSTYVYDYRNELTAVGNGRATSTYAYDYLGNRISVVDASGTTTVSPTTIFSKIIGGTATTTKNINLGSVPVAAIETAGATTTTRYILTDHLGSPTVILNASSSPVETLDYFPYGGLKVDSKVGSYGGNARKYIDQVSDASGLNYFNARYENPNQGQFITQDPVFLGTPSQQNIQDPQSLNSYSYSDDNPIVKSDPNGKVGALALAPFLFDAGAAATLPAWAGPALIGAGVAGVAIGAYSLYEAYQAPTAPGSYQATVEVSGQGYDPDFKLPDKPPKGPWGAFAFAAFSIGAGIVAASDYAQPILAPDPNTGLLPLSPQSGRDYGALAATQSGNNWSYSQMRLYSTPSGAVVSGTGALVSGPHISGSGGSQAGTGNSGGASSAGYSAFTGLFNPFTVSTPSTASRH